ncbi:hypothetical protein [Nostoc sp. TCL240-02]|uniref:hypothetical protein n=1 Tax=Nostoc sp. TCL240-02 TaxID=2572090 RepID=UPI00157FA2E9|nr:hypothetical protein [Nostoc sp. TCL240-02]QKQ74805.1 hypothetical protein FBB35_17030 [Nostoc sp. TCL240-02]
MADINGNWLGTYWQDEIPSRFEATFVQNGNVLKGSILDDNYLGEATVSGKVIGRNISFTKLYLITSPSPVTYTGTVSENEDYMQGRWSIGSRYSGLWEAQRDGENLIIDLQTRLEKQTLLTTSKNR